MSRWLAALEDILCPRGIQCLCCDARAEEGLLCSECMEQLQQLRLSDQEGDIQSVWSYSGCAKRLVLGLKEDCVADCASVLADGMADVIREMNLPPHTVLTWVTMPARRRRVRGIDHGRLLCKAVAARTGMEAREILQRIGTGHTQRGLPGAKRRQNLSGRFQCSERLSGPVLLIDDVLTTGATAQVCREVLLQSGAEAVYVLTATCVTNQHNQ